MSVDGRSAAPTRGAQPYLSSMTEDELIAYAIRMSLEQEGKAEEKMDVEDQFIFILF